VGREEDRHLKLCSGEFAMGIGRVGEGDEIEAVFAEDDEVVCVFRQGEFVSSI
jgi:hypothetical protein